MRVWLQVLCHVTTRLKLLHKEGLAHRDLKPGNVLWRPQHLEWTLIDFGCAAAIGALQLAQIGRPTKCAWEWKLRPASLPCAVYTQKAS